MRRILATLAAAAAGVGVLTGCSSSDGTTPVADPTSSVAPSEDSATATANIPSQLHDIDPSTIDVHDPEQVAVAAVETMYTYLPALDAGPNAAMLRAAPLLTEKMAAGARDYRPPTGPGREWQRWADTGTFISADAMISPQQRPPDTDRALRYMTVEQTTTTARTSQKLKPFTLVVALENTSGGWRLASILQR
ncbi:hypothetical protein [Prescottella subtropica]|uniref:hypothetical protein n=1 Tax=Prescottella subtropica TaxID=2545757 RepID=UPI0010F7E38F|nr:hypothetical protein [Prescottella subtropica]